MNRNDASRHFAHPPAVAGAGRPGAAEVRELGWIELKEMKDRSLVTALENELDEGEAVELGADSLLLDERKGREVASRFGLKFRRALRCARKGQAQGVYA